MKKVKFVTSSKYLSNEGVMDPKDVEDKKQTRKLRRPFGVAAIDITEYLNGQKNNDAEEDKQIFIPFQSWVILKEICILIHVCSKIWFSRDI